MDDLVRWIGEQLDAEAAANESPYGEASWHAANCGSLPDVFGQETSECDCGVPARVLREIEAKRRIVEQHRPVGYGDVCLSYCHTRTPSQPQTWPCLTLRLLALPYADRPGYQEGWAP